MSTEPAPAAVHHHQAWYKILYVQVLIAILAGVLVGYFKPDLGKELKPLGDGFIALIKMMIAPVIFCTVVHGISSMGDLKRVGRVGLKTLIYFEAVSTVALAVGLLIAVLLSPVIGLFAALIVGIWMLVRHSRSANSHATGSGSHETGSPTVSVS